MEVKFYWNGSFVGTNHSMEVDGQEINLCGVTSDAEQAKTEAIRILKETFNAEYKDDEIEFQWGGRL